MVIRVFKYRSEAHICIDSTLKWIFFFCLPSYFVKVILRCKPCPKFYEALGLLMLFIMEDAISCWEQAIHTMSYITYNVIHTCLCQAFLPLIWTHTHLQLPMHMIVFDTGVDKSIVLDKLLIQHNSENVYDLFRCLFSPILKN